MKESIDELKPTKLKREAIKDPVKEQQKKDKELKKVESKLHEKPKDEKIGIVPSLGKEIKPTKLKKEALKDPVKEQQKKDKVFKKVESKFQEKPKDEKIEIVPSLGVRIDLQHVSGIKLVEGQPRPKFVPPRTKKLKQIMKQRREELKRIHNFCKYETIKIATPIQTKKLNVTYEAPSPEASHAKVPPRRVTPTGSALYPYPQTAEELEAKKPKSGIFLNEKEPPEVSTDYDSFDLVYTKTPRSRILKKGKEKQVRKKESTDGGLANIQEEAEEGEAQRKGPPQKKAKQKPKDTMKSDTIDSTKVGEKAAASLPPTSGGPGIVGEKAEADLNPPFASVGEKAEEDLSPTSAGSALGSAPFRARQTTIEEGEKAEADLTSSFAGSALGSSPFRARQTTIEGSLPFQPTETIEDSLIPEATTEEATHTDPLGATAPSTGFGIPKRGTQEFSPNVFGSVTPYSKPTEREPTQDRRGEGDMDNYLTKQFRRKVSQISQSTSYQSEDFRSMPPSKLTLSRSSDINKFVQKFKRDSEVERYKPKRKKIKRGTLESHSFTKLYQPTLKEFFFGSKEGTMHQGDDHFSPESRNHQGICMPVAAYCFAILKHPNKWTTDDIDEILEVGNKLYLDSSADLHMHGDCKEVQLQDLKKYCYIGEKKIRFMVDEPEVCGVLFSDDKRVYNLTKGLQIFFARQNAGILHSNGVNLAIWKDKYYYFFDPTPRTKDLYMDNSGTAIMANFYDLRSIVTVLINRSNYGNWPFVISSVKAFKILDKDAPEEPDAEAEDMRSTSYYNILTENKAVLVGSFDLGDKCFQFSRNKQALAMAVVALVYSRITPPSSWRKETIDKIMIIGDQLYTECAITSGDSELLLINLPALFTVGPYIVEIYIYANRFGDTLYKNCKCQFRCHIEEFFKRNSNAIVQLEISTIAVWKQRNMYFCFDPYSRSNEGHKCRDGAACVSMHTTLDSLVNTISVNFDNKDSIFYIHGLKVCKIHRDPVQSERFALTMTMADYPLEEIKKQKLKKSKKAAIEKPVTVDYSALAMVKLLATESPEPSVIEVDSRVESIAMDQLPSIKHDRHIPKAMLKAAKIENPMDLVADLDSPSLSDTQIEPPLPEQPKDEEVEFMDLDTFDLTQEELELQQFGEDEDYEAKGGEEKEEEKMNASDLEAELNAQAGEGEGEGEDDLDWFLAAHAMAQVGGSLPIQPSQISEEVNTDITNLRIIKEVLYPTYIRDRQQMKRRYHFSKTKGQEWQTYVPREPSVTQSEELKKETNFLVLPDNTQLIRGTKNMIEYSEELEFMAPFVCIMAATVSRKYSILSWSGEIVDYVLKCGAELYKASKFRYDQVTKLEIPRICLGKTDFAVLVEYVFDTYLKQNILEMALDKILFMQSDMGILVTPLYACAVFNKNHLYYLYDGFGNNEVGLSEGPNNTGAACFARFKDVHSLATRILYNKKKRDLYEEVDYTRFVLSTVQVKKIERHEDKSKRKKKADESEVTEEEELMAGEGEEEPRAKTRTGGKKDVEGEKKQEPKVIVGYKYKDGVYIIEGSKVLQGRNNISEELKEDHFVCLCACLMVIACPVKKWDNKKVDQVIEHGRHVYAHAEDLEISEKRSIKNVLIEKNFFDIIVRKIKIVTWSQNKNLKTGIDTLLTKKLSYFLVQFPNACYVVHKSTDEIFHLFDPYGVPKGKKMAGWIRCDTLKQLKFRLKSRIVEGAENYTFYTFEVSSIRRAPKEYLLSHRLHEYELETQNKDETFGKPFYEDPVWLKADPVPWSRILEKTPAGYLRGNRENMWCDWDIEYTNDLFSLVGNIHQTSAGFSEASRGKQTLCNLVMAIGMLDIYEFEEWNSAVIDSILVNGDNYFMECTKDINDEDYELSMDDLKGEGSIFPFTFKVEFTPVVEGTMFLVRHNQFNLYKALRYFFTDYTSRCGIICALKSETKKHVAFGKIQSSEYFMFDCETLGAPMFLEKRGVAYMLRMTTLNRLLHVLTLTLRGGDFYIFEVETSDLQPIS